MGCFEGLISAVCWWLTAHFCNNMSKNAFCFVFGLGSFCLAPAPLQFQWKSFSDYPTPFFIAGFSFWFRQKNKRTYFLLWPILLWSLCTCVWSLFYFGFWLFYMSCWNLRLSESWVKLAWAMPNVSKLDEVNFVSASGSGEGWAMACGEIQKRVIRLRSSKTSFILFEWGMVRMTMEGWALCFILASVYSSSKRREVK